MARKIDLPRSTSALPLLGLFAAPLPPDGHHHPSPGVSSDVEWAIAGGLGLAVLLDHVGPRAAHQVPACPMRLDEDHDLDYGLSVAELHSTSEGMIRQGSSSRAATCHRIEILIPDRNGVDSFAYHANDGQADSIVATVQIAVTGQNLYLPLVVRNH